MVRSGRLFQTVFPKQMEQQFQFLSQIQRLVENSMPSITVAYFALPTQVSRGKNWKSNGLRNIFHKLLGPLHYNPHKSKIHHIGIWNISGRVLLDDIYQSINSIYCHLKVQQSITYYIRMIFIDYKNNRGIIEKKICLNTV